MGKRRVLFASAAMVVGAIGAGGVATAQSGHSHPARFLVRLDGAQEVPVADPDGQATARVTINTDTGQVCWDLHWRHIAAPTLAHIHGPAPAGSNAAVFVGFISGAAPFTLDRLENTNHAAGCTTTTPQNAAAIVARPQQYYVNIHNGRFPAGAVRGQMG